MVKVIHNQLNKGAARFLSNSFPFTCSMIWGRSSASGRARR